MKRDRVTRVHKFQNVEKEFYQEPLRRKQFPAREKSLTVSVKHQSSKSAAFKPVPYASSYIAMCKLGPGNF